MIKEHTVFVLGAGASMPYGFPSGLQLRSEIITGFIEKIQRMKEFENTRNNLDLIPKMVSFINTFNKSSIVSIDLFLSRNPEFEVIGKMAIAISILVHERENYFNENSINSIGGDWYSFIFNKLTEGLYNKDDGNKINDNNVSFITFNYDRSFEYYMNESLYNSFSMFREENSIKQFNFKLPIHHVYGSLGSIDTIAYGLNKLDVQNHLIKDYIKDLKTIYQERKIVSHDILSLIHKAERVFFLGFSFLPENLEILQTHTWPTSIKLYGTTKNINNNEFSFILKKFPNKGIGFYDGETEDSLQLLKKYL